jgi:Flp pilus assembly protein TadG
VFALSVASNQPNIESSIRIVTINEEALTMKTKGQALAEMVCILPLFLLVFGIFQFGWMAYIKNTFEQCGEGGVRQAAVTPSLTDALTIIFFKFAI